MTYAKPSTPYIITVLLIFAVTALDGLVLSKKNSKVVEISTRNSAYSDSIATEFTQPTFTYTTNLQAIAP